MIIVMLMLININMTIILSFKIIILCNLNHSTYLKVAESIIFIIIVWVQDYIKIIAR